MNQFIPKTIRVTNYRAIAGKVELWAYQYHYGTFDGVIDRYFESIEGGIMDRSGVYSIPIEPSAVLEIKGMFSFLYWLQNQTGTSHSEAKRAYLTAVSVWGLDPL